MDKTSKEYIIGILSRKDAVGRIAVERALVHLYNRQTKDEKQSRSVRRENGIGFTPADAQFMSSCAVHVINGRHMSEKQMYLLQKPNAKGVPRIAKYWRQLQEEALKKIESNK